MNPSVVTFSGIKTIPVLSFSGATYDAKYNFLPRFNQAITLTGGEQNFTSIIVDPIYVALTDAEETIVKNSAPIADQITITTSVVTTKKKSHGIVSFIPIRKNPTTGNYEKLQSFGLINSPAPGKIQPRSAQTYAANSVLQYGNWYKIGITSNGIYKLSYSFLKSLGIDIASVNPKNIRIFGNGGGMLPELNSAPRPDDLNENAIFVQGENDAVFNTDDYVLFYAQGQVVWAYNASSTSCPKYQHTINLYSDTAYYFITTDLGPGKRIQNQLSSPSSPTNIVTSFDDYAYREIASVNFIQSGKQWFGDYFDNNSTGNFVFNFPNIDVNSPASVKVTLASQCYTSAANYTVGSRSASATMSIPSVTNETADPTANFANIDSACYSFSPSGSPITVSITKQTPTAIAWLQYIEVNARRLLTMSGDQMIFRDAQSVGPTNVAQYNLTSGEAIQVWDITDIYNVGLQAFNVSGTNYQFVLPANTLRQFIAFTGASYNTPQACGVVANQNLHAMSNKNYIIVTNPAFYQQAVQLATYHEERDTLSTIVVTPQQIYNEFSSGSKDIAAIRNFVKMFYDKAAKASQTPQYLLLFGEGSFDPKNRTSGNTDFVPTYQSENSISPVNSYVSDDWYGLLDDGEGLWEATDMVDIGVGRFLVYSPQEAQVAVNKVLSYTKTGFQAIEGASNPNSPFGNWRNMVCFMADDQDQDIHISQADQLATYIDTNNTYTYKGYNIDKIYLDAYQQVTAPGGDRYPTVNIAINERVAQGALIMNWTGHGGVGELSHTIVVNDSSIQAWANSSKLFFFVTASCDIGRYDNPAYICGSAYAFINPNGGAIALLSAGRETYSSPNFQLNQDVYQCAFVPINGRMPRLGDIYYYVKTQPGGNTLNSRNFSLLGDPALTLAYPKYKVVTDSINKVQVTAITSDTLKALSLVTISGHINDNSGNVLNTFNGVVYPTVYDKASRITTLSNKGVAISPPFTFQLRKNILFNGQESVTNGRFRFSFVVPKDIAYQYGVGRVSYYAENGTIDASGYNEQVIIGGYDNSAVLSSAGPKINLYMNNDNFVSGGITNQNPNLYAVLFDNGGIDIVGNTPGHNITAVLDGNSVNPIILNQYYQSNLNTYQSGTVLYPFSDLSVGKHTLSLMAWDVYDNSAQATTEFIVANSAQIALSHVLNYPNPFTTKTQFYFEQNQADTQFEVQIQIFTVSGKLVKTIDEFMFTDGYRCGPIDWDGRDDFGEKIGKGVYIYRLKVKTNSNGTAEQFEKLVILN